MWFLDVLVLIIWFLLSVLGCKELFWVGVAVGLFLFIVTGFALGWVSVSLVWVRDRLLEMLGIFGLFVLINYFLLGCVDHYVLLVMILYLCIGCLICILTSNLKVCEFVLMGVSFGIEFYYMFFLLHIVALLGLLVVAANSFTSLFREYRRYLERGSMLLATATGVIFIEREWFS